MHFLLLGGLLYALYAEVTPPEPAGRTIIVDRPAILQYLQYRAKRFDPVGAGMVLDRMSPEQLKRLEADYVQQEVLYRQAVKYGLDRGDDVIKQRMIQQSRFLLEDRSAIQPTKAELESYYQKHISEFSDLPRLTLTHVFYDDQLHGAATERLARAAVQRLNAQHVQFSDAKIMGDRFPYLVNYVDRPIDYIAEYFGDDLASKAESAGKIGNFWQGPWHSKYGWHAVMITNRTRAKPIPFPEARDEVKYSFIEERLWQQRKTGLAKLMRSYDIKINVDRASAK